MHSFERRLICVGKHPREMIFFFFQIISGNIPWKRRCIQTEMIRTRFMLLSVDVCDPVVLGYPCTEGIKIQ